MENYEDENTIEMVSLVDDSGSGSGSSRSSTPWRTVAGRILVPASPLPLHKYSDNIGRPEVESDFGTLDSFSKGDGGGGHALPAKGTATNRQVAVNIFISFVGAGLLGMPYAFSRAGWLLGSIALTVVSTCNVYAMLLLVKIRRKLESSGKHPEIAGYGDIGRIVAGPCGEALVNICLVISQLGFATAYIIFIAANLNARFDLPRSVVCAMCVPILSCLVQVRDMKVLSPFSLVADLANLAGLSAVLFEDFEIYSHGEDLKASDLSGLIYMVSIAIYSLEGVALVLPLETSAADRAGFPSLLKWVIFGISSLMMMFGIAGYAAFGTGTLAPVTLNLEGTWVATFVKLALCLALYLTYPVMMFPVNGVVEENILPEWLPKPNHLFRAAVVFLTALVAYSIPDFSKFLGLVGSSICMLLGFILPCFFHMAVYGWGGLKVWERILDLSLIIVGTVFGVMGTYNSFKSL